MASVMQLYGMLIEPNHPKRIARKRNGSQMSEKGQKHVVMEADVEVEYYLRQGAFVSHCDKSELVLTYDEVAEVFADIARMFPYMGRSRKECALEGTGRCGQTPMGDSTPSRREGQSRGLSLIELNQGARNANSSVWFTDV